MNKIIDAHVHTYPESVAEKAAKNLGEFYNFTVQCAGTYEDLTRQADETGTVGFFLLAVATAPRQVEKLNTSTAELVRHSRSQGYEAIGFGGLHQDYEDLRAEVTRCDELGLAGIKIHPDIQRVDIDDPKLYPVYDELQARGMKLYLHMGDDRAEFRYSRPSRLAKVLDMFPDLVVIAAHFGGYRAWDEARDYLWGRKNVWYDASSTLWDVSADRAVELIRGCGVENVLYGSDYPVIKLSDHFDLFMKLALTEEERKAILYDNAKRFMALCK